MRLRGEQPVRDPDAVTPVQARQGFLDRPVLAVLVVSLVLAGGALLSAYMGVS